jgi:1-deoxy-D-xylulose-5-phosphate synthase
VVVLDRILEKVESLSDLRKLGIEELNRLAEEVRELIIETVSHTGGHLAANLGVVELTIALLYVFDAGADRILWDVSHQSYAYKILTGRRDRFCTIRQYQGLSGFLRREESEYDHFGAGHSGTALSAALGMAAARDRKGESRNIVAVMGDGSAGCGISLEALNNLADVTERIIVVLNDNEMSIASNVGSISNYLGSLLANPRYNRWKRSVEGFAQKLKMGWFRKAYYRLEEAIKSLFLRSVLFEEFGLRYVGPINGHNLAALIDAFTIARDYERPIILHVNTHKGRGYKFAEEEPEKWHGTAPFDIGSGELKTQSDKPTYSNVFGVALERIAAADDKVVAITAAMPDGTGLTSFAKRYPDRFFDVGICEEHAVVFAAGLAAEGMKPVFAVYSTFLQRAVDCVIHDVCLQGLPVVFCVDRAGVVGDDGPTHHGVFDIALLRCVPNITIMQPADEAELADMLNTAIALKKPVVVRYPRGRGPGAKIHDELKVLAEGKALVQRQGRDVWLWAIGDMTAIAAKAAGILEKDGISAGVVNARFVKPIDTELLAAHASQSRLIATLENGIISGGFGSGVEDFVTSSALPARVLKFGWPDEFVPHGAQDILFKKYGLDAEGIAASVKKVFHAKEKA